MRISSTAWFRSMLDSPKRTTYPKWTGLSQYPSPVVPPREIPPLLPPASKSCPNHLPFRPDPPQPPTGFTSSRHIIPAAYPRSFKQSTGKLERGSRPFTLHAPDPGEGSEGRKKRNLEEARECVRQRFEAESQTKPSAGEAQLWIAGECWTRSPGPKGPEEGLTLVVSAANGFTKEVSTTLLTRIVPDVCFLLY